VPGFLIHQTKSLINMAIKPGTVVQLKSGGPVGVVTREFNDQWEFKFWDGAKYDYTYAPEVALNEIDPSKFDLGVLINESE
jgi:uncharacterized protein YodC (DUF2158 family)